MPTHWESSTRPLFVRTVVVNGNRHAILSAADPHGQTASSSKQSRPTSPQSSSSSSISGQHDADTHKRQLIVNKKGKSISPRDLQSCLIKLRVVLATQEARKSTSSGNRQPTEPVSKKRKHSLKQNERITPCVCANKSAHRSAECPPIAVSAVAVKTHVLDINQNIAVASFFTEPKANHCGYHCIEQDERIIGYSNLPATNYRNMDVCSTAPTLGMSSEYDVPWNNVPPDNYYTRPFYNRLSDRVMQWLDLSSRKSANETKPEEKNAKIEPNCEVNRNTERKKTLIHRGSSEDNSDEVRTDEDVETALSTDVPKFARELNRQHYLKSAIPVKQTDYPTHLQESIANSFTSVVSIQPRNYTVPHEDEDLSIKVRRKGYLTRQVRMQESSDDEGKPLKLENFQGKPLYPKRTVQGDEMQNFRSLGFYERESRSTWSVEQEGKQQLHIFIPVLPEGGSLSDSESINSTDS